MTILRYAALGEGLASSMLLIFVPFYVRSGLNEPSFTMLALITSFPALTTLISTNLWGATADITTRYSKITGICFLGFFFSLALIPFLENTVSVIAAVTFFSLLYGAVRPMLISQGTLHKEKSKVKAISSIFTFESLGFFIGGLAFAYIYNPEDLWTERIVFPAAGVVCLIVAVVLFKTQIDPPQLKKNDNPDKFILKRFLSSLGKDLFDVYHCAPLLKLAVVVFIASLGNYCFFGMFSFFYTEAAGGSLTLMSVTLSISTITGMLFFPVARRWVEAKGGKVVLKYTLLMWVGDYLLLFFTREPISASILFTVPIYPFFLVAVNTLASDASSSDRRGGGLGALAGVSALSMAIGIVSGGATGDYLGVAAIPLVSSVFSSLAFLAFLFLMNSNKVDN